MLNDTVLKTKGELIERAVIILHGLGDNANGIMGLGEVWSRFFENTVFLAPNAPFPCPYAPGGFQWFDAQDWSSRSVLEGVRQATPYLIEYINKVKETYALPQERIALVGFSQGTMMSLYVAPRLPQPLAGVLGYSGALIGGDTLETEKQASPPVLLVHGTADDVVPFTHMELAEKGLQKAGIPVRSLACPGISHGVDERGLLEGASFLKSLFE